MKHLHTGQSLNEQDIEKLYLVLEPLQGKEVDSHQEQDTNSDALLFCYSPANQLASASSFIK